MAEAIIAEGVSKFYRIRETKEKTPTRRLRLAQFFLGESFKGKVEVKRKKVVDDFNLSIQAGEFIALLGRRVKKKNLWSKPQNKARR
jgi:ABC-type polysaccharide/polyol phosphate transport system ATPase subunit